MIRVPSVDVIDLRVAKLEALLAKLQNTPEDRREAEFADEKEATIRELIESLRKK